MQHEDLILLLVFILILLALCAASVYFVVQEHDRTEKLKARLNEAMTPTVRHPNPVEEQLSLTRTVSRSEQLKEKAANFIGVDLKQAETYPIKWWLVPPMTLALTIVIVRIASHPLARWPAVLLLLTYVGFPVIWVMTTKLVFNRFTNKRNAKLLESCAACASAFRWARRCARWRAMHSSRPRRSS